MSALYVIATPIGNLEDISLRAIRILNEVKLIAAEDTRSTRHLLKRHGIKTRLTSYHEHTKRNKLEFVLNYLQKEDVALVSEAGMPGLSDPGYELINAAIENSIPVVPIPGASAVITALVVSGLPTDQFLYLGFLPRRKGERRRLLQSLVDKPWTMVAFEAPHRVRQTLEDVLEILGDRRIAVCRELTKLYEEIFRGTLDDALTYFQQPKGEFTLVLAGNTGVEPQVTRQILDEMATLYRQNIKAKEAIAQLSKKTGLPKKKLYKAWLSLSEGD